MTPIGSDAAQPMYQLLYTSVIAADVSSACIADIVRVSRARNLTLGVTGVLIFDGWRFFQYLEGEETNIRDLLASISKDPRHSDLGILHAAPLVDSRRFPRWSMGYALSDLDGPLDEVCQRQGEAAVDALLALVPRFDLDP